MKLCDYLAQLYPLSSFCLLFFTRSNSGQSDKRALSSTELNEIFTKITHSQDTNILQGVVDIVEATGDYEISTSTFDFDLYGLNTDTLFAIKKYLQTVS